MEERSIIFHNKPIAVLDGGTGSGKLLKARQASTEGGGTLTTATRTAEPSNMQAMEDAQRLAAHYERERKAAENAANAQKTIQPPEDVQRMVAHYEREQKAAENAANAQDDSRSLTYEERKEQLRSEAEKEFIHNTTDWGQTIIRNFAVNSDYPQMAGIVNYLQLLMQSPKGIEYERYTAAEQEAEKDQKLTEIKDWASENGRDPVLSAIYGEDTNGVLNLPSGMSLITAPLQGADYILDALETAYVGAPLPSSTPNFTETTQTLREGVSQDMTETGQFFYNAAMSTADSAIAGTLGGSVGGGIILGLGAASNAANDIKNRGGTDEEALIGGAVSGILEGAFEKISLGQLEAMRYLPADTVKNVLGNIAKSVVTNAGEEFSTELANAVFDTIFMGELSTYELTVKGYLSQGMSEADARLLANQDVQRRLGESALSGALTGVLFGAGASANGYYRSQLAAQGEAKLLAGEMPTPKQLEAMGISESEALGALAVFEMEKQEAAVITDGSHLQDGQLTPGVTYKTGEHDYIYRTNADGLICRVTVDELQFKTHDGRLNHNPKTYGKQEGDHAGHLIGDRFGGSPELDNLVSQAKHVNKSEYFAIENQWAAALEHGHKVAVQIDVKYDTGSSRPTSFIVSYEIDGKFYQKKIKN